MSEGSDSRQAAAVPGGPAGGFTPERDRRLIMFSCLVLMVFTVAVFLMIRARLVQLRDVSGAYVQVAMTAAESVREQAQATDAALLVGNPGEYTAKWLESSGSVAIMHDKKGQPLAGEHPNPALGCVYWLDNGLPVTAVRPAAPVVAAGGRIRFWGQLATTDVAKLEFSEELREEVCGRFGLQPGQEIAIFFASEIVPFDEPPPGGADGPAEGSRGGPDGGN